MTTTQDLVDKVVDAARRHGQRQLIVLSGAPATGKTFVSWIAASALAEHELLIKEVQFHPSYTYDSFIEGFTPTPTGGFTPTAGVFVDWASQARQDPDNTYVLIIEEMSRANVPVVLGELMTYLEHRERSVWLPITGQHFRVPENLVVLATMNPKDRSALELDEAVYRRLRIIDCPPDPALLTEVVMPEFEPPLLRQPLIDGLAGLFEECASTFAQTYATDMPFGHAAFDGIGSIGDLEDIWNQQLAYILNRPGLPAHPYYDVIERRISALLAELRRTDAEQLSGRPSPDRPAEDQASVVEAEAVEASHGESSGDLPDETPAPSDPSA